MTHIGTTHAALISAMDTFYRTLLDLDYLRANEVQFPPHIGDGKTPLAAASMQAANLTPDVQALMHFLPYTTEAGAELNEGESAITLYSQPVSYLYKGLDVFDRRERFFGYGEEGEQVLLPEWAVLLFFGVRRDQHVVAHDTRSKKIAELDIYSPTVQGFEAAAMEVDDLLGSWNRNLQTLVWIPWRDEDLFLGLELPPSSEQNAWLKEPEKRRLELVESLPQDIAEKTFDGNIKGTKEDNDCYWAKRLVYGGAGWPGGLDEPRLREGIRELEQALWDAWDGAQGAKEEEEAERGVYGRFAGGRGV